VLFELAALARAEVREGDFERVVNPSSFQLYGECTRAAVVQRMHVQNVISTERTRA
jgi:RNase P/RNase MRP subunit POP5